jgi:hypothetical protein
MDAEIIPMMNNANPRIPRRRGSETIARDTTILIVIDLYCGWGPFVDGSLAADVSRRYRRLGGI